MKEIALTRGQIAIVDDEDFERLSAFSWHARLCGPKKTHWYAYRGVNLGKAGGTLTLAMHREVTGAELGEVVDHIDGNGLNNTRANLRVCTPADNARHRRHQANQSGLRGVHPRRNGKYQALIRFENKLRGLGTFTDPIEAAFAYDAAAIKYFGEFAVLNFPRASA